MTRKHNTTSHEVAWTTDGLRVSNAQAMVHRPVSASTISGMNQCPAQWAVSHAGIMEPIGALDARALGSVAHESFDRFFALPGLERTPQALTGLIQPSKEYANVVDTQEWREAVLGRMKGYLDGLVENPVDVNAVFRELRFTTEVDGVKVTGSIDRVTILPDGSTLIDDYKTDKAIRRGSHDLQLMMYALAFPTIKELVGLPVPDRGRLLYVKVGGVEEVAFTGSRKAGSLRLRTIKTIHSTRDQLDECGANGFFPAKTSNLCGWCAVRDSCPVFAQALAAGSEKLSRTAPKQVTGPAIPMVAPTPTVVTEPAPALSPNTSVPAIMTAWDSLQKTGVPVCHDGPNPWTETGAGGLPNPGSYAAGAVADLTGYAAWLLWDHGFQQTTPARLLLAQRLLGIVFAVQEHVAGVRSLQASSNNRARDLVKQVLKVESFHPPLDVASTSRQWDDWDARVTSAACQLWDMSFLLLTMPTTASMASGAAIAATLKPLPTVTCQ
jgi:putative RecB family exonuclease